MMLPSAYLGSVGLRLHHLLQTDGNCSCDHRVVADSGETHNMISTSRQPRLLHSALRMLDFRLLTRTGIALPSSPLLSEPIATSKLLRPLEPHLADAADKVSDRGPIVLGERLAMRSAKSSYLIINAVINIFIIIATISKTSTVVLSSLPRCYCCQPRAHTDRNSL